MNSAHSVTSKFLKSFLQSQIKCISRKPVQQCSSTLLSYKLGVNEPTRKPQNSTQSLIRAQLFCDCSSCKDSTTKNSSSSSKKSSSKKSSSEFRHNYEKETEQGVNQQILAELNASYAYMSMACYFGRTDVALPGCQGFFLKMHEEELQHARFFINYQNQRGGRVILCPICAPEGQNWESICRALGVAMEMEKLVKDKLLDLMCIANKHNDQGLVDIIASDFITDQDRSICEFGRLLTRACKMTHNSEGEFLFDRQMFETYVKSKDGGKEGYK